MVDYRKIKRWLSLTLLFCRLFVAFFNPFHSFFLDFKVYKICKMAVELEYAIDDSTIIFLYAKKIEDLIAEFVSNN